MIVENIQDDGSPSKQRQSFDSYSIQMFNRVHHGLFLRKLESLEIHLFAKDFKGSLKDTIQVPAFECIY